jgi:hypothetical protein
VVAAAVGGWWVATANEAPGYELRPHSFAALLAPAGAPSTVDWPLVALAEALLVLGAALALVGAARLRVARAQRVA